MGRLWFYLETVQVGLKDGFRKESSGFSGYITEYSSVTESEKL